MSDEKWSFKSKDWSDNKELGNFARILEVRQEQTHNLFVRVGKFQTGWILSSESSSIPWWAKRKRGDAADRLELPESHETTKPEDMVHYLLLKDSGCPFAWRLCWGLQWGRCLAIQCFPSLAFTLISPVSYHIKGQIQAQLSDRCWPF